MAVACCRRARPHLHLVVLNGRAAVVVRRLRACKGDLSLGGSRRAFLHSRTQARNQRRPACLACNAVFPTQQAATAALPPTSQRSVSDVWLLPSTLGGPQGPGDTADVLPSPSGLHRLRPASFSARTRNRQVRVWAATGRLDAARIILCWLLLPCWLPILPKAV